MKKEIVSYQKEMKKRNIDWSIIPTNDYHLSEYVGAYFKIRAFLSGFSGSAGTLLIGKKDAFLWTDGRYFVQAEKQLEGSGIQLMKAGEMDVPTIEDYLLSHMEKGEVLNFDGRLLSAKEGEEFARIASTVGGSLNQDVFIDLIWKKRPDLSFSNIFRLREYYTGRRAKEKLEMIREKMTKAGATCHVLETLDDIAWVYNLRGNDVPRNPVFLSYSVITEDNAYLFVGKDTLTEEDREYLEDGGLVTILDYDDFYQYLKKHVKGHKILTDLELVNYASYEVLKEKNTIISGENPSVLFKAIKNTAEKENMKEAHVIDGLAVCKFIYWVKEAVKAGEKVTELSAAKYLDDLRLEHKECVDLSFDTISAYGANAAMCHYTPDEAHPVMLQDKGFLLVDSGGQYLKGTTDITRTISLGELTEEEKRDYTMVLRGHIRLAMARFPKGTSGANLDILARGPLWDAGLDYNHGTGHGVGFYLNVHEGPNTIHWNIKRRPSCATPLEVGMFTSNEPGYYLEDVLGIRLENLILTVESPIVKDGSFLEFETVTHAPFDREAILPNMMEDAELAWLNDYHKNVFDLYGNKLSDKERAWLEETTAPLSKTAQ